MIPKLNHRLKNKGVALVLAFTIVLTSWFGFWAGKASSTLITTQIIETRGFVTENMVTVLVDFIKSIGKNPTSLGVHNNYLAVYTDTKLIDTIKATKVKMVRFFIAGEYQKAWKVYIGDWNESTKNFINPNWADFDTTLQGIYNVGAEPIISLEKHPKGMTLNAATTFPDPAQFAAYAKLIAEHIKDWGYLPPKYWEIWNEAYSKYEDAYDVPNPIRATAYVNVFNATARAIHEVFPDALCGTDSSNRISFLENYLIPYGEGVGFLSFYRHPAWALSGTGYKLNEELLALSVVWTRALTMRNMWYERQESGYLLYSKKLILTALLGTRGYSNSSAQHSMPNK